MIATAGIAEIPLYYKTMCYLKIIVKYLLKGTHFVMLIYRAYEQLTPIYDNVSSTGKKYLTYFPILQIVSGKGSWNGSLELSFLPT